MNNLDLPLFSLLESTSSLTHRPQETRQIEPQTPLSNPLTPIENAINSIFPQQTEENKIIRTRTLLGKVGKTLPDEQIECINTEYQFMIDTWLDEYEKALFNGTTLQEILNDK